MRKFTFLFTLSFFFLLLSLDGFSRPFSCHESVFIQSNLIAPQNVGKTTKRVMLEIPLRKSRTFFYWEDFFAKENTNTRIKTAPQWRLKSWDEIKDEDAEAQFKKNMRNFVTDAVFSLNDQSYIIKNSSAAGGKYLSSADIQYVFKKMSYSRLVFLLLNDKKKNAGPEIFDQEIIAREITLAKADILALEQLVFNSNYKLYLSLGFKLCPNTNTFQGEACFDAMLDGYYRAIDSYDWTKGLNFSTFLSTVLKNTKSNFFRQLNIQKYAHLNQTQSLDSPDIEPIADDSDAVEDHFDRIDAIANQKLLDEALQGLEPRHREIVSLRFGLDDGNPLILKEVGNRLGITKERVRQIQVKAMEQLQVAFSGNP